MFKLGLHKIHDPLGPYAGTAPKTTFLYFFKLFLSSKTSLGISRSFFRDLDIHLTFNGLNITCRLFLVLFETKQLMI